MNGQKKNIDIRVILDQLNIPMEAFEQWQAGEAESEPIEDSPFVKNRFDSWNFTSSFFYREASKPDNRKSQLN